MIVLLAAVTGFLAGRLLWLLLRPTFALPLFARRNFRGIEVPTATGLVLPLAALVVEGGRALAGAAGVGREGGPTEVRVLVLLAAAGLGLVGAFDDLARAGDDRGYAGHLRAMLRGRLTTGGVKLLAGAAVALVVVAPVDRDRLARLVMDALIVALAANLGNLLDRAPGRALKVGGAAFVVLAVGVKADDALSGVALVTGAAMALMLDDLHERLMLGDAGSNVLGGVLGLGVVLTAAPGARAAVLIALAALNLLSEAVSFGRVIDAVPPLRSVDRIGRRP